MKPTEKENILSICGKELHTAQAQQSAQPGHRPMKAAAKPSRSSWCYSPQVHSMIEAKPKPKLRSKTDWGRTMKYRDRRVKKETPVVTCKKRPHPNLKFYPKFLV